MVRPTEQALLCPVHKVATILTFPEDLGGHTATRPSSLWSMKEFQTLEGLNDAHRGAVFFCQLGNTEPKSPTGVLSVTGHMLFGRVVDCETLACRELTGRVIVVIVCHCHASLFGCTGQICSQLRAILWYRLEGVSCLPQHAGEIDLEVRVNRICLHHVLRNKARVSGRPRGEITPTLRMSTTAVKEERRDLLVHTGVEQEGVTNTSHLCEATMLCWCAEAGLKTGVELGMRRLFGEALQRSDNGSSAAGMQ